MRFDFANYTPTQKRITEAAVDLFAAYGYAGASMEKIAAKSGFSSFHVQRVFKTKHNLFEAAVFYALYSTGLKAAATSDGGTTFEEQITGFYRGYVKAVKSDIRVMRLVFYAGLDHPETIRRFLVDYIVPLYDFLSEITLRGQKRGEVRRDIEPVAAIRYLLAGIIYHFIYAAIFRAGKLHKLHFSEKDLEHYLEIGLRGVGN